MKNIDIEKINLSSAVAEYKEMGRISYSTVHRILGVMPKIPNSIDADEVSEAYKNRKEYLRRARLLEKRVKQQAKEEEYSLLFAKAVEEYKNFGIITPHTMQKLLSYSEDSNNPDERAKILQRVAFAVR